MLAEVLEYLAIKPGGTYCDATAGLGGHTRAIAEQLNLAAGGRLICLGSDDPAKHAEFRPDLAQQRRGDGDAGIAYRPRERVYAAHMRRQDFARQGKSDGQQDAGPKATNFAGDRAND